MDNSCTLCYKKLSMMTRYLPTACLCASAVLGMAAAQQPSEAPRSTVWDVEGMYAQARTMLEDKTIHNVSAVPAMLEGCDRAGYEPARLLLLDVYEGTRKGIEAAPEKAFDLAGRMAAAYSDADANAETRAARLEAMYRLALYYERGFGCQESPEQAYKWMRLAAMAGLYKAQVERARYLMNGIGHSPAPKEALAILRWVSVHAPETPHLFFYLGYMCMNGVGMSRPNRLMARRFFEIGAHLNDARAINNLATMYELGIGVSKDSAMALRLYKRAADLGCKDASANMQRLAYKTDSDQRHSATWQQRVGHAGLRVVQAMPLSPILRQWIELPFQRLSTES